MLFKLSFKNMKKSIKDYAIYFLTLVLRSSNFLYVQFLRQPASNDTSITVHKEK